MVVGRGDSQSRWTIPLTIASRSVLGGMSLRLGGGRSYAARMQRTM